MLCCVLGAGADATSGAAGEGTTQKTPTELHIQYLTCEADEKLQNLVRGQGAGRYRGWQRWFVEGQKAGSCQHRRKVNRLDRPSCGGAMAP